MRTVAACLSVAILMVPACGEVQERAVQQSSEEAGGQEAGAAEESPLSTEPKPAIDGFARWRTECPFPFSFQHPEDWARSEVESWMDRGLTLPGGQRFSIGVYEEVGEELAAQRERTYASELDLVETVDVGGAEARLYGSEGGVDWVFAPFKRERHEPTPGLPGSGGTSTFVAILSVAQPDEVGTETVLQILGSLEPNGCDMVG